MDNGNSAPRSASFDHARIKSQRGGDCGQWLKNCVMVDIITSAAGRSSIADQQSWIKFQCKSFNVRDAGQPGLSPFAKCNMMAESPQTSNHGSFLDKTCKDVILCIAFDSVKWMSLESDTTKRVYIDLGRLVEHLFWIQLLWCGPAQCSRSCSGSLEIGQCFRNIPHQQRISEIGQACSVIYIEKHIILLFD